MVRKQLPKRGPIRTLPTMTATLIGYARCSTDQQDLAAQRQALLELGVAEDRIYTDHGLTGTTRARPGLDQALAAVRAGDTLVVPKLDRLARSVPDARAIADQLRERGVKLVLGRALYDPGDPMGKMFFNILATFAEFEADLIPMRTREGMAIARARGKCAASSPNCPTAAGTLPHACHRRVFHQRSRRTLLRLKTNRLSHTQPAPFPLAYDPAPYRNRPAVVASNNPGGDPDGATAVNPPVQPPVGGAAAIADNPWTEELVRALWQFLSPDVQEIYRRVAHGDGHVLHRDALLDAMGLTARSLSGRLSSQGHAMRRIRRRYDVNRLPHPMAFDQSSEKYRMLPHIARYIAELNL